MYDTRYIEFFRLFNREEYFEAHEVLESLWRETKDDSRNFYQGLIQLAACLVHQKNGNTHGAGQLLASAARYLGDYPAFYKGTDVLDAVSAVRACVLENAPRPQLYLK